MSPNGVAYEIYIYIYRRPLGICIYIPQLSPTKASYMSSPNGVKTNTSSFSQLSRDWRVGWGGMRRCAAGDDLIDLIIPLASLSVDQATRNER